MSALFLATPLAPLRKVSASASVPLVLKFAVGLADHLRCRIRCAKSPDFKVVICQVQYLTAICLDLEP